MRSFFPAGLLERNYRRIALVCVLACALFAAIVVPLFSLLYPDDVKVVTVPDKSVQFEFAQITQGTNHVIFLGNPIIARVKWALRGRSFMTFPRNLKADWAATETAVNRRVLWIGFGNIQQHQLLHCSFRDSHGYGEELRHVRSLQFSSWPKTTSVEVQAFELPATPGRFSGAVVRLYSGIDSLREQEFITLQMR